MVALSFLLLLFQQVCAPSCCANGCDDALCSSANTDVEAQRPRRRVSSRADLRQKALDRFHRIMDQTVIVVIILSMLLSVWSGAVSDIPLTGYIM